ncbi:MAG: hypothetical protein H0T56_10180, partial [Pseudaminobacter sp.]|nr:hypothetical protein [Pseudaminobacter sp.]
RITAGDMLRSLDLHEAMLARRQVAALREEEPAVEDIPGPPAVRPASAENVTPLTLSDRKRIDP